MGNHSVFGTFIRQSSRLTILGRKLTSGSLTRRITARNASVTGLCLIILAVAWFYLTTIRPGHSWGDDFSQYILHARNIAAGTSYADTGYIYNPLNSRVGPRSYPPLYPLVLAPIYKLAGLNLGIMKVENILIFLAALGLIYATFQSLLPAGICLVIVGVLGFNPYFWGMKDQILSDFLFLLLCYASLAFIQKQSEKDDPKKFTIRSGVIVGGLILLATATRSVGMVLVPCLLCYELVRFRRLTKMSLAGIVVFAAGMGAQTLLVPSDRSYIEQFFSYSPDIGENLQSYVAALASLWQNGSHRTLAIWLFCGISALAVVGFASRLRRISFPEIFFALYSFLILLWPSYEGLRFLIPILPLYVFYTFVGLERLPIPLQRHAAPVLTVLVTLAIFVSYLGQYSQADYGTISPGVTKPASVELFDFIKRSTSHDDVFVFRKPRALALFADRATSVYVLTADVAEQASYLKKIKATYIVSQKRETDDRTYLAPLILKFHGDLEEVFQNTDFVVYKLKSTFASN